MRVITLALILGFCPWSLAEDIQIPIGQQGIQGIEMPKKGQTMTTVAESFGAAQVKHPARGNPPITRWEYENFVVYFEGEHVIHSVLRHKPKAQFQTPTN